MILPTLAALLLASSTPAMHDITNSVDAGPSETSSPMCTTSREAAPSGDELLTVGTYNVMFVDADGNALSIGICGQPSKDLIESMKSVLDSLEDDSDNQDTSGSGQ